MHVRIKLFAFLSMFLLASCNSSNPPCGPERALVTRVIDGDTIEIENSQKVRYILVDTPELSEGACFAEEAKNFNETLVLQKEVRLEYDQSCTDKFGRLLAYVYVDDICVNEEMIKQGYGCVFYIPPDGQSRVDEYREMEQKAISRGAGLWGVCEEVPCKQY